METISTTKRLRAAYNGITVEADIHTSANASTPNINSGNLQATETGQHLGTFSLGSDGSLYLNTASSSQRSDIYVAVEAFIADALADATDAPEEA